MDEYSRFAFLYDPLISPGLRPLHREILNVLGRSGCSTVIDLCCGTGVLAGMAVSAGMKATGVDLSPAMLARAVRKQPATFIEGDATTLTMEDDSFDGAAISFALHEKPLELARGIVAEARRVVRPGGVIVIADYRLPEPGTGWLTGRMIAMIERMAGKEHHAHFSEYMELGGTDGFLPTAGLAGECTRVFLGGWAGVYRILVDG